MLLSMTAYGSSTITYNNAQYLIELYSVNKKGVDFSIHLNTPSLWLENEIRKVLSSKVKRGQIICRITFNQDFGTGLLNPQEFLQVGLDFLKLESDFGKKREFSLDFIFQQAQRIQKERFSEKDVHFFTQIKDGLDQALSEFDTMKKFEGENIRRDFFKRLEALSGALCIIQGASKETSAFMGRKIRETARSHGVLDNLEKDRFYAEVAYLCDKYDIHEECIRLESHIKNIHAFLKGDEKMEARSTGFVLQEMMREANTLCAKSPLSEVKTQGVLIKAEIEKFREQLQNVE